MAYVPFYTRFPDMAVNETRVLTVYDYPGLPMDEYGFVELFCDEPECDCRRVIFNVRIPQSEEPLAVIAYGWETGEFYARWFSSGNDPDIIRKMQGPILNIGSYQSKLAPALLTLTQELLLSDEAYVERLTRHYAMFKREIEKERGRNRKRRPLKPKPKRKPKRRR